MSLRARSLPPTGLVLACALLASCSGAGSTGGETSPPERIPTGQLPDIDAKALLAHTRRLSSDEFEGRLPGTLGEELAVGYLVDQFRAIGLKPGSSNGTYIQKVPLVGITSTPGPLIFKKGGRQERLRWKDEFVAWTKHVAPKASLNDSDLVFVGYGVVAPEFDWDDYKGVDMKGKTLVMLVNDPPVPDPRNNEELDPKVFGGKAMTYYGRWTYKYEIAALKGAAGALIVHETGPAGYPFSVLQSSNTGEKFDLLTPDENRHRAAVEGWIPVDQARKLFELAGLDFDALKQQAATRAFQPVPLGVTASISIRNTLRLVDSRNVLARLEGSDPAHRDELVIYTAHWDHLGKNARGIFHGAEDDALGCGALLELGRAYARLPAPPRRSILFLAVTAEEQGLLGSEYYSIQPVYPLARTLADINLDSWNVHGRTRDMTIVGYGFSDLDGYVRDAAGEQGRLVHGDTEPEKGFYYRSDHFNLAKQGVPAISLQSGSNMDYIGRPAGYADHVHADWTEHRYHQPSDVVTPDWDLSGTREDLKVALAVGYRVAQAERFPEWHPGTEFRATRDRQLRTSR
jgi:Zn-dependent M28 family amino/carboxypeptidase